MDFFSLLVIQSLNALSQASILFFIASGLTLIFGIMRIVNFAHGALYMLGAYIGYTVAIYTGSFFLALIIAPILVACFGIVFEKLLLSPLYKRQDGGAYLMVTFGLAVILAEAIKLTWGADPKGVQIPEMLRGIVIVFDFPFPKYRVFLIIIGVLMALSAWLFLEKTRIGLLIRAVSQNPQMVNALGTNFVFIRNLVFAIGCGLAGMGGVLAAPMVTAFLGMGSSVIIDAFVIVIIGGMGSFLGSIIGSLLVAFVLVFGAYYVPDLALAIIYLLMLIILIVRPGGLLGKEA